MPVTIGGSGPITGVTSINTTVSDTELGYLDGVTSAIQSQINTAGGLVKITDAALSGSSVSINNCFTSTYDNYRVIISDVTGSGNGDVTMRLRASGTDASGSNYSNNGRYIYSAGPADYSQSGLAQWGLQSFGTTSKTLMVLDVAGPAKAQATYHTCATSGITVGTFVFSIIGGIHSLATAYDGFSLLATSGTFSSGNVRVYGYRN